MSTISFFLPSHVFTRHDVFLTSPLKIYPMSLIRSKSFTVDSFLHFFHSFNGYIYRSRQQESKSHIIVVVDIPKTFVFNDRG